MTTSWYIYMRPFTNLLQVAFRIYGHLPFQLEWIGRAFLAVMKLQLRAVMALLGFLARYRARCRLQGFAHKGGLLVLARTACRRSTPLPAAADAGAATIRWLHGVPLRRSPFKRALWTSRSGPCVAARRGAAPPASTSGQFPGRPRHGDGPSSGALGSSPLHVRPCVVCSAAELCTPLTVFAG